MNRRNFIKAASCGALLTGALPSVSHAAAENRPPIPGSLGMLYDSTLCVGCQACVTKWTGDHAVTATGAHVFVVMDNAGFRIFFQCRDRAHRDTVRIDAVLSVRVKS